MKAVNLLPHDELSAGSLGVRDPLIAGGALVTALVIAGVGGVFLLEHSQAGSAQQQLTLAQAHLAEAQAHEHHQQPKLHVKPIVPTPSVTSQELPWRTAVASAMSTRIAFDRVLQDFERVVPSDVTVTNLTMGAPGASASSTSAASATATANGTFSLTGSTFSEDSVARLMSRLMLLPDLTNVSLSSSQADAVTGVVTFTVLAQVKGAAPATTTTTTTTAGATA